MKYLKSRKGSLENSILSVWSEAVKKEGNAFGMALQAAKANGDKKFTVSGKTYDVEEALKKIKETNKNDKSDDGEGMDAVQPKAVKKKFKDRKDKDIDNDGDVDSSDKYLHKRRKTVSKAIKGEANKISEGQLKEIKKASLKFSLGMNSDMMKAKKDLEKKGHKVKVSGNEMTVTAKSGSDIDRELSDIRNFYDRGVSIKAENFEVGTKERTDHTLKVTPGQSPEEFDQQVSIMHKKKNSMREALAKMWGIEEGKNPFDKKKEEGYNKVKNKKEGKTLTGKAETKVEVEPKMEKKK